MFALYCGVEALVPNVVMELNFTIQLLTARCLSSDIKGLRAHKFCFILLTYVSIVTN